ncbi:hypothetical protein [Variovorax gossypii]
MIAMPARLTVTAHLGVEGPSSVGSSGAAHERLQRQPGQSEKTKDSAGCAAEFGLVEKELLRFAGVGAVLPDYIRRSVRIEHRAVPEGDLVAAVARSGFEVGLGGSRAPGAKSGGFSAIAVRASAHRYRSHRTSRRRPLPSSSTNCGSWRNQRHDFATSRNAHTNLGCCRTSRDQKLIDSLLRDEVRNNSC